MAAIRPTTSDGTHSAWKAMEPQLRIAISGAGIAGPTLAYWLRQSAHDVLLVEEAPELRNGGYVIDFWGVGYDIAERMNLLPGILDLGYQVKEVRFVDPRGRRNSAFSTDVIRRLTNARFTSLRRADLSRSIYNALDGQVETLFGDSIVAIEDETHEVRLVFDHAPSRTCDLVIGADGQHSRVRQLLFGPEAAFELPLGYYAAAFEVHGYRPRDELVYVSHAEAGKQISRFSMRDDKTLFLFVFRHEQIPTAEAPVSDQDPKAVLRSVYADVGWEWPRIQSAMDDVEDIYFDRVSQIRMDRWTRGRAALVGDAAACVSLMAGEGTGIAMCEAYVLAGELRECRGDYMTAFGRYEQRLRPFLERKQKSAAKFASAFAPRTAFGIAVRDAITRLLQFPPVADFFIGRDLRDDIVLPNYGLS
jgi:2-polyprenyl-6-methoxyphenol hydroxylase-like FAD-dependent oxidoreductase